MSEHTHFRRHGAGRGVAAAAAMTLAFGLAACGSNPAPPATSTEIDDSSATGKIEVWAASGIGDDLPRLLEGFEADNPDADVNVTVIPSNEVNTRLQTAIAAGTTPDVTFLQTPAGPSFFSTGAISPVPDGLVDAASFYDKAYESTLYDGVSYAVPWYAQTRALFIRKDIMEDAGLTPPETWDDAVPFFKGMMAAGVKQGLAVSVSWDAFTGADILEFIGQGGGSVIKEDLTEWTIDSPEVIAAVEHYASLFEAGVTSADGPAYLDTAGLFVNGDLGAVQTGPWSVNSYAQASGDPDFASDKLLVVPLPAGLAGNASILDGANLVVFEDAKNAEGAWKLVRHLAQPETQIEWLNIRGLLPAVKEAADDESIAADPHLSVIAGQLENTLLYPQVPSWAEVMGVIAQQAEKAVRGETDVASAMQEAQRIAEGIGTGD